MTLVDAETGEIVPVSTEPTSLVRRWQGTSRLSSGQPDWYDVLNPSGVAIAFNMSWRVARKIADLYNADVELRRFHRSLGDQLMEALLASGAVSLQEEA